MGRKSKGGEGGGLPAWMGTYGDMMTLVLCFFVLLFAMSSIDSQKYNDAVYSFKGSFGVMTGGTNLNPADLVSSAKREGQGSSYKYQSIAKKIKGDMEKFAGKEKAGEKASKDAETSEESSQAKAFDINVTERGIVISVAERFLFDSGSANLKSDAGPILDLVLETISNMSNSITVEGHTDNVPISTRQFPSNWELSGGRAASVVRYFIEKNPGLNKRVSIGGYGDTRPKASNSTIEGRSSNRRVEIIILKTVDEQYEEKAANEINSNI